MPKDAFIHSKVQNLCLISVWFSCMYQFVLFPFILYSFDQLACTFTVFTDSIVVSCFQIYFLVLVC